MAIDKYLRYGFAKNNKRLNSFFFWGLFDFMIDSQN